MLESGDDCERVATDYMKIFADQIRPFVPKRRFVALGTDGFGQSDTRESLRNQHPVRQRVCEGIHLLALFERYSLFKGLVSNTVSVANFHEYLFRVPL